jgi:hypothetical protein
MKVTQTSLFSTISVSDLQGCESPAHTKGGDSGRGRNECEV